MDGTAMPAQAAPEQDAPASVLRPEGTAWATAETAALLALCWPRDRLGQGLEELTRRSGLRAGPAPVGIADMAGWPRTDRSTDPGKWIEWAADRLGAEAESVDFLVTEFESGIGGTCPAVLGLHDGSEIRFLLLLRGSGGSLRVIGPDLKTHRVAARTVRALACAPFEVPLLREINPLLDAAGVPAGRRARARAAMLRERLAARRVGGCWILRQPATAPFWSQLVQAGLPRRLAGVIGLLGVTYGLEIIGWVLIGAAALNGTLDLAWLTAWLLLLASNLPFQLAASWLNATFALDLGRILKKRLLVGSLMMEIDAVRHQGVGQLLGRVMEAQALESLALNGGMATVVAFLELGFAAWILASGAGGAVHLLLLVVWLGATLAMSWRYYRQLRAWTANRLDMTHDLVEHMVGHRTRLAQEWPARRDAEEDAALKAYLDASAGLDRGMVPVGAAASGGWLLVALLGLAPAFILGTATPVDIAIGFGGIMLANRAFAGISSGIASLGRASMAWELVADMFRVAGTAAASQPYLPTPARAVDRNTADDRGAKLIDASELVFRYRPEGEPVLRRLDLSIRHGERVLLEGQSGGGKSTLAALLTGLRVPESGLLLLDGLDRHTLGPGWHQFATEAPQFHENHILTGTLGFNLLMGRNWPASEAELEEARQLCIELGLGGLLERMPAGMMQQVGETGWQLSHGERSRIFLARALLQNAKLTILDESFAALDPETLKTCLECAFKRARTLVVIAHP